MTFTTTPLIGIDIDNILADTTAKQKVGTQVDVSPNGTFQYVYAGTTIAAYDNVWIQSSGTASPITPALAITAGRWGAAQTALTSGWYGWVQTSGGGNLRINVLASCNSSVPLYTTDTAGSLDDATNSASQFQVQGLLIVATNSGSASNVPAIAASYPIIRRPVA